MDGAHSHGKGGEIADAIDKAERQNKAGVVALEPTQRGFDAVAPTRKPLQNPHSGVTADPEGGLIPGKASEPARRQQQERLEQTLRRGKAGKQDECLALEKGPAKRDQIKAGAVFSDELLNVHSQLFPAPSR